MAGFVALVPATANAAEISEIISSSVPYVALAAAGLYLVRRYIVTFLQALAFTAMLVGPLTGSVVAAADPIPVPQTSGPVIVAPTPTTPATSSAQPTLIPEGLIESLERDIVRDDDQRSSPATTNTLTPQQRAIKAFQADRPGTIERRRQAEEADGDIALVVVSPTPVRLGEDEVMVEPDGHLVPKNPRVYGAYRSADGTIRAFTRYSLQARLPQAYETLVREQLEKNLGPVDPNNPQTYGPRAAVVLLMTPQAAAEKQSEMNRMTIDLYNQVIRLAGLESEDRTRFKFINFTDVPYEVNADGSYNAAVFLGENLKFNTPEDPRTNAERAKAALAKEQARIAAYREADARAIPSRSAAAQGSDEWRRLEMEAAIIGLFYGLDAVATEKLMADRLVEKLNKLFMDDKGQPLFSIGVTEQRNIDGKRFPIARVGTQIIYLEVNTGGRICL